MDKVIQVTNKDKEDGIASNCYECPIALAIIRRVKPGVKIRVGAFGGVVQFEYSDPNSDKVYTNQSFLPGKAIDWYTDFDCGFNMRNIRFTVDIPEWATK